MSLESAAANEQPKNLEAQDGDLDVTSDENSARLDEKTLNAIYGGDSRSLAMAKEYGTNNGWVNFRDQSGVLRAMPFSKKVAERLSELGYTPNAAITVVDSSVIMDINQKRQEGGNSNFARGLENDIMRVFSANQDREASLDDKYRV